MRASSVRAEACVLKSPRQAADQPWLEEADTEVRERPSALGLGDDPQKQEKPAAHPPQIGP